VSREQKRLFWALVVSYVAFMEAVTWITSKVPLCIVDAAKYGAFYAENHECPAPHVVFIAAMTSMLEMLGHDWVIAFSAVATAFFTCTLWISTQNCGKLVRSILKESCELT
jgi:hypothetical protein